jgi:hypothetical protein
MVAAETARRIAEHHPALDADAAYVMALLHDIGRTAGGPDVADVRHVLDGYRSMLERGFDDSARICLTHSFPIKQADAFAGRWDCPGEEKQFVQDYLDRIEFVCVHNAGRSQTPSCSRSGWHDSNVHEP